MAETNPPLFLNVDSTYTAASLGLPYRDLVSEGVLGTASLNVSQRGAGANMSVDVAAGTAWIQGDDSVNQPCYRVVNDATKNLSISAAHATNARNDIVIAEVRDSAFSGVNTDWQLRVVAGTAAASPGTPTTPNNALLLAVVNIPATDTTIGSAQITDKRALAQVGAGVPAIQYVTSLPLTPYDGQVIHYAADAANGVIWQFRYNASSASSYKWEFVGGPPMYSLVATQENTSSSSYTTLTTAGPTLTVPLTGEFMVTTAASIQCAAGNAGYMSYTIGGTAAADADAIFVYSSLTSNVEAACSRTKLKTLAASSSLASRYKAVSGGTNYFQQRTMMLQPVRVG